MRQSPLQLDRYFFTKVQVTACPDSNCSHKGRIETHVDCGVHKDEPRKFRICLNVKLAKDGNDCPGHDVEMETVGLFHVAEACPEEKVLPIVQVNGPSILYGAIREMLANITARTSHGPFVLPTVSFADLGAQEPPAVNKGQQAIPPRNPDEIPDRRGGD